jgi:CO/xanthine dehydrogenase Mo-binding subunit
VNSPVNGGTTRREFLAAGGALVVSFSVFPRVFAAEAQTAGKPKPAPKLPGSLQNAPMLDSWIRIGEDGSITVFTGKVELGQGIKTALLQVAAEELVVEPRAITLVVADTGRTPDERYTAGSQSMQDSATAIRNAAAQVRALLVGIAAGRFGVSGESLTVGSGGVGAPDGRRATYGELVKGSTLHVEAQPVSPLRDPGTYRIIGKSLPRIDIPPKLAGVATYVQDLRLPGMVHARIARPPSYGAQLRTVETARIEKMRGVLKVVRNGRHLAVIAEREYQAVTAMRALARGARWDEKPALPPTDDPYAYFQRLPAQATTIADGPATPPGAGVIEATYRRPYQMHGSIGPSCAVGLYKDETLTVWTHSQGVYPLRGAIAEMLRLPVDQVRCIHLEGSGCYGHNGADDAGADAALLAVAFPGRPVRVQWMREEEHAWEPYGSLMVSSARARLSSGGEVTDWQYEVWSNSHNERPGPAGQLAPALHLQNPFEKPAPKPIPQPTGGGDRNAIPLYKFGKVRVIHHFIAAMPLRVSALRALGAYHNVFAIESFVDELALSARADPVEFRLRHLEDSRAADVIRTAAERFGWSRYQRQRGRGRGFGFARYKNLAAYCAIACEVQVDRDSGRVRLLRAVAAIDSGEAVNPDGIRNQTEGGILQAMSWTLYEAVTFDQTRITSLDWATYPILRFQNVPDSVEVHVINRPGQPFLGTGEAAQGPMAAALANAIADAAGVRIRELPMTSRRVKAAIGI